MLAPRFDLTNVEFRFDERHEIFQFHLGDCAGVRLIVSTYDDVAEGVRGDGDAITGRGRKLQAGAGVRGDGSPHGWP